MKLHAFTALAYLCAPALSAPQGPFDPGEEGALAGGPASFTLSSSSFATEESDPHGDHGAGHGRHAPIGVMGDHVHGAGEWMISVTTMRMHMEGLTDGGDSVSNSELFGQGFMVAPLEMDMDMLMLGGMYAPTDRLTLMVMVPWFENSMEHVTAGSTEFETESSGLGDVELSSLVQLIEREHHSVHLNLGLSLPTGSIDETDDTPMMANAKLPYAMQLGTGTFDLLPGLTYVGEADLWSWGAQGIGRLHLGENDEGYRYGNRFDSTGWLTRTFGTLDTSLRLNFAHWSNIHGADADLNPAMVPTADPKLQGGDRLDALLGLSWHGHQSGHRLGLEFGLPMYQDLDGPALETDWTVTLGWQLLR